MRSAYATSPSISAPPLSASSSYASSVPTYSEESVDDHERDASRLGVYRSTAAAPPLSPPRVSNHGPPGAFLGVPPLRVDDDGQHPPHVNCPDALSCLQDTNDKPSYTLPIIIRAAILGTASGRLTITDIYAAIIEKYPYFATLPPDDSWKQSVRHHLSLSNRFVKVERRANEPGRGAYWTVDLEAPPGTKRPRKRNRKEQDGPPRPRGRPRKVYDHPVGYGPDYDKPIPLPALMPHPSSTQDGWQMDEDASYDEDEAESKPVPKRQAQAIRVDPRVPATPRLHPVHW
ncbi:winged helix DNA-binding domain-containing protein [Peniophora sp. CONT]|nr:winged helix DNA-binding domain-containing protein [Peniophora sp. CONT]